MSADVSLLQELPTIDPGHGADGCCALGSLTTCPECTFTCNASF